MYNIYCRTERTVLLKYLKIKLCRSIKWWFWWSKQYYFRISLYPAKFLDTSTKPFFPCSIINTINLNFYFLDENFKTLNVLKIYAKNKGDNQQDADWAIPYIFFTGTIYIYIYIFAFNNVTIVYCKINVTSPLHRDLRRSDFNSFGSEDMLYFPFFFYFTVNEYSF